MFTYDTAVLDLLSADDSWGVSSIILENTVFPSITFKTFGDASASTFAIQTVCGGVFNNMFRIGVDGAVVVNVVVF